MEPHKETETPGSSSNEIILHEDTPSIVTPTLGGDPIEGYYMGDTADGTHHIFKHKEGHTFHVPFFGQMESALKTATEKAIDPIGKFFKIIVLLAGKYLIKIIQG